MKRIVTAIVHNRSGVLNRVTGLFTKDSSISRASRSAIQKWKVSQDDLRRECGR